jgi:N-methylhydantoinase A
MDQLDWRLANRLLEEMAEEGRKVLEGSGLQSDAVTFQRTADMRYIGQGHEVSVTLPEGILNAGDLPRVAAEFERTYEALYGRKGPEVPLEVINWRVVASGPPPDMNLRLPRDSAKRRDARKGSRLAYFPEQSGYVETPIYDRYALAPGARFDGPAIVEERESTLIVGARAHAWVDERLNVVVELNESKDEK